MQQASVKDGNVRFTFSRDKEIIPYIDQYWDAITAMPRRVTQSWYTTVQRSLTKDVQTLFTFEETENGPMFGLMTNELTSIRPEVVANGKQDSLGVYFYSKRVPLGSVTEFVSNEWPRHNH